MINQYNSSSRMISLLERLLTFSLRKRLEAEGLEITVEEWRILFYLWNEDGLYQNDIAKQAKKEKSTITRKIDALVKKGYIQRRSDENDKRNKRVYLTKAGKNIEKHSMKIAQNITDISENNISNADMKVFYKVLSTMLINLDGNT